MNNEFKPEVNLSEQERSELATLVAQPGFKVVLSILRSCVDTLAIKLLQTPSSNKDEVLAIHQEARVAGVLFELFVNHVNREIAQQRETVAARSANGQTFDETEGLLDLGDNSGEEELF